MQKQAGQWGVTSDISKLVCFGKSLACEEHQGVGSAEPELRLLASREEEGSQDRHLWQILGSSGVIRNDRYLSAFGNRVIDTERNQQALLKAR